MGRQPLRHPFPRAKRCLSQGGRRRCGDESGRSSVSFSLGPVLENEFMRGGSGRPSASSLPHCCGSGHPATLSAASSRAQAQRRDSNLRLSRHPARQLRGSAGPGARRFPAKVTCIFPEKPVHHQAILGQNTVRRAAVAPAGWPLGRAVCLSFAGGSARHCFLRFETTRFLDRKAAKAPSTLCIVPGP